MYCAYGVPTPRATSGGEYWLRSNGLSIWKLLKKPSFITTSVAKPAKVMFSQAIWGGSAPRGLHLRGCLHLGGLHTLSKKTSFELFRLKFYRIYRMYRISRRLVLVISFSKLLKLVFYRTCRIYRRLFLVILFFKTTKNIFLQIL